MYTKGEVKINNKVVKYTIKEKALTIGYGLVLSFKQSLFKKVELVLLGAETPTLLDSLVDNIDFEKKAKNIIYSKFREVI